MDKKGLIELSSNGGSKGKRFTLRRKGKRDKIYGNLKIPISVYPTEL